MVNYEAVTIGLKVEFQLENEIKKGIVKYKGPLNCKTGDWIGIEAEEAIGYCDGRLNGRVYFKCPDLHGLFLTADELRKPLNLLAKPRKIYKSIGLECDELLFKKSQPKDYVVCITQDYLECAKTSFEQKSYDDIFSSGPRYTVSETLVFKPKITKAKRPSTSSAAEKSFHPVSSISKTYMPKEELELYTKLNWSHKNIKNLPRNASVVNKTFDSFNLSRSNYIEPNIKK